MAPSISDPLLPVSSWRQVRDRSVLPYGIVQPWPLYHYLLYGVVQVLPITEWSLRLPSLLAGLATIVALYALCRRWARVEVAVVAALLVAVEPMQVVVSTMARPYALASLACVLSFLTLDTILRATAPKRIAAAVMGYGLALALIGYMNAVLLLVVCIHVAVVSYVLLARRRARATPVPPSCSPESFLGWPVVPLPACSCGRWATILVKCGSATSEITTISPTRGCTSATLSPLPFSGTITPCSFPSWSLGWPISVRAWSFPRSLGWLVAQGGWSAGATTVGPQLTSSEPPAGRPFLALSLPATGEQPGRLGIVLFSGWD